MNELLAALTDIDAGVAYLGDALFDEATINGDSWFRDTVFDGDARFRAVKFGGVARFDEAKIRGHATFWKAEFAGGAGFDKAEIGGDAYFSGARIGDNISFSRAKVGGTAQFSGVRIGAHASFDQTEFAGDAGFDGAKIAGDAWFCEAQVGGNARLRSATIGGTARFERATVKRDALFDEAKIDGDLLVDAMEVGGNTSLRRGIFERAAQVGPLVCRGTVNLSEAVFRTAVIIEVAAAAVLCRRTRWSSTAALRLRYARVDLSDAVLEYPVSIAAQSRPFMIDGQEVTEPGLADPRVRIESLRGVDAVHLVLTDVDLTDCRFAGTIHLDQLRLEGLYLLATTPTGLHRRGLRPVRWTPRRTLAEEHHWRATRHDGAEGWTPPPDREAPLEPIALAPVYRQLRKAFEDSKHEPGAADFYYGEMEMRRYAYDIPWGERALLTAYWALSGYGLRASRALGWLVAAMTATVLAMMLWGLPQDDPTPIGTGILTERRITLTTDTPDPVNPAGPLHDRLSAERFEKSLRIVINSVVFRSSGQNLTTAGTYTEMTSRLVEPVLLGLAALAIRSRVKR